MYLAEVLSKFKIICLFAYLLICLFASAKQQSSKAAKQQSSKSSKVCLFTSYLFFRLDLKLVERIILAMPQPFINGQTNQLQLKEILNAIVTDIDQHCNLAHIEDFYAKTCQAAADFELDNAYMMSEYDQLNYLPAINGDALRTAILRNWGNDTGTFKV